MVVDKFLDDEIRYFPDSKPDNHGQDKGEKDQLNTDDKNE
jgi:hypothetical protein